MLRFTLLVLAISACVDAADGTDYGDDKADGATAIKYPSGISPTAAREMRTLVKHAATQAWSCDFNAITPSGKTASAKDLDYTLAVQAVNVGGPEADIRRDYSVHFTTTAKIANPDGGEAIEGEREMIVSYISFVEPGLEKIRTDDGKVGYNYVFGGSLFNDELQVVADGHGGVAKLVYEKVNHAGSIIMQIGCTPG